MSVFLTRCALVHRAWRRGAVRVPHCLGLGSVGPWMQAVLLDSRQLALEAAVLLFLCRRALVSLVREVLALERVALEVIHLPLAGDSSLDVVVLGDLPAALAQAHDVLRRLDVGSAALPRLGVVVG